MNKDSGLTVVQTEVHSEVMDKLYWVKEIEIKMEIFSL